MGLRTRVYGVWEEEATVAGWRRIEVGVESERLVMRSCRSGVRVGPEEEGEEDKEVLVVSLRSKGGERLYFRMRGCG